MYVQTNVGTPYVHRLLENPIARLKKKRQQACAHIKHKYYQLAWVVRESLPEVAKTTVPRLLDCVTGSSLILAPTYLACTVGSPFIPNCWHCETSKRPGRKKVQKIGKARVCSSQMAVSRLRNVQTGRLPVDHLCFPTQEGERERQRERKNERAS